MTARHFARTGSDHSPNEPLEREEPTSEEDATTGGPGIVGGVGVDADEEPVWTSEYAHDMFSDAPRGRHFRGPEVVYVPTVPTQPFVSDVPKDPKADEEARALIDEILRELDAQMAKEKQPKPVREPESDFDPEPDPEPGSTYDPVPESVAEPAYVPTPELSHEEPEPDRDPESASGQEPGLDPKPESVLEREPGLAPEPESAPESAASAGSAPTPARAPRHVRPAEKPEPESAPCEDAPASPAAVVDAESSAGLAQVPHVGEGGQQEKTLESTLVLDRSVMDRQVLPVADAAEEVRLVEPEAQERLEVSTSLPEPVVPEAPIPPVLAAPTRRMGFFERIGAFVVRLLHLDDRR